MSKANEFLGSLDEDAASLAITAVSKAFGMAGKAIAAGKIKDVKAFGVNMGTFGAAGVFSSGDSKEVVAEKEKFLTAMAKKLDK